MGMAKKTIHIYPLLMDLARAQNEILRRIIAGDTEKIPLAEALGRVSASTVRCRRPIPHFSYSSVDGYAIAGESLKNPAQPLELRVIGELAAGATRIPDLQAGQALKIMTGAAIPAGTGQVVPVELCEELPGAVRIKARLPKRSFIRRRGVDMSKGRVILRRGERMAVSHLDYLAANGCGRLQVYKSPQIHFFCIGNELTDITTFPAAGRKINSNSFLLEAMIRREGGVPVDHGLVADKGRSLRAVLERCGHLTSGQSQNIIISTGGTGPGKYDLAAESFREMGGKVVCRGLNLRPGTAFLFGSLGEHLYFGLPGPPPAINSLFPVLVAPALRKAQGLKDAKPTKTHAILSEEIIIRQPGVQHLKGGRLSFRATRLLVTPANGLEPADTVIIIPARRKVMRQGEEVTVYLNR